MLLKIGELAKRIGVTVRTLHHYDAIGLVKPSARSDAGYRLYNRNDIARLHRIQALRGLGLSLAETDAMLAGEGAELRMVIKQQITSLQRQISETVALCDRLQGLEAQLVDTDEPDIDDWLSTLRLMATHRKYFTQEEMDALFRRKELSSDVQWRALIDSVRDLMDHGIPADSEQAQSLASKWLDLQTETMSDDPRLYVKLSAMHRAEFDVQALTGVDGPLLDYVLMSIHEMRCNTYAKTLSAQEMAYYRQNFPKCAPRWQEIFAETRQLMEQGVPLEHSDAKALFLRWAKLFQDTWGKDPATRIKVREAQKADRGLVAGSGLNAAMQDYVMRGLMIYAPIPAALLAEAETK